MAIKHSRVKTLFKDDFTKLQNANVLLLGVGGVGGVCLECLYKSGVEQITIVDFDTFDETNINRQLFSEQHIGEKKVQALKKHYPNIEIIDKRVDEEWVKEFDFEKFDVILDAIDDTKAKLALAQKCYKKLISSFGSANRLDPTKIKVDDIWKSYGDRLGSKIRYELRKRGFNKKYKVIFSSEEAHSKGSGSFMGVSGTFGLTMCSYTIKKILGK